MARNADRRPRVLIIGAGFGGLEAAKAFRRADVNLTILDRRNHHLFQPLLYQVATAALAPAQIASPIREVLKGQENAEVHLGEARQIDLNERRVRTEDLIYEYDYLVIATGARHSYFGHDEWERFAPGLKAIEDAIEIRQRFLAAFEIAEKATDPNERDAALTFVVVGGGPTGVEMAGAMMELARFTLRENFRRIDPSKARVILVEGGSRVLGAFPEDLSESARRQLEEIGVIVRTGSQVTGVDEQGVCIGDERIEARNVIWAAGNAASPLLKSIGPPIPLDRAGRAMVREDLSLPDHPEVFVIGDAALVMQDGQSLPGLSPVAMQEGRLAAANIQALVDGQTTRSFRYFDKGSMATIGKARAVAEVFPTIFKKVHFSGLLAWFSWLFVHLIFLIGFRNKVGVLFDWFLAYLTNNRGSRLITRDVPKLRHPPVAVEPLLPNNNGKN